MRADYFLSAGLCWKKEVVKKLKEVMDISLHRREERGEVGIGMRFYV